MAIPLLPKLPGLRLIGVDLARDKLLFVSGVYYHLLTADAWHK